MNLPFESAPPADVAGVVERFDAVLAWARQNDSRLGYFAALYRGVTLNLQSALATDTFENPRATERLLILFAGRYFEALAGHFGAASVARSWQVAFASAGRWSPIVSQHLLLGINTHISLDLGIAAARTLEEITLSRADFDRVNDVLLRMIDEVERKLAGVWPLLSLLDGLVGRLDETLVGAALLHIRAKAWTFAQELSAPGTDQNALIAAQDQRVAEIGSHIASPGLLLRVALSLVRLGELRSVVGIIDLLDTEAKRLSVSVEPKVTHQSPTA